MVARRGQHAVAWTARPGPVARAVLSHAPFLAALVGLPALVAVVEGDWPLAAALGVACVPCLAGWAVLHKTGPPKDLRGIEAACVLAILFLAGSLLPVPGFLSLGMDPLDALFEAASGITSTGLTVATGTENWSFAAHFLRGWLQWCGGFAIVVAGMALLIGPGDTARALGRTGIDDRDILSSSRTQARAALAVYALLTVLGIALLLPLMPSTKEAVLLTLAAVSTGGFTPRPDSLAGYTRPAQAAVLALCLATTLSLLFYIVCRRDGLRRAIRQTNAAPVLVWAVLGTAGAAAYAGFSQGEPADMALNLLSAVTTAGFSVAPVNESAAGPVLLLLAMVVGGGAGSTAGGIKIDRIVLALRMYSLALLRMRSPPAAVTTLKARGALVSEGRIVAFTAVVLCYAISLGLLWLVFAASGAPPLPSLFDIVSALSTVGLSTGVTGPDLVPHLKAALIAAMLLGRLEFLALILALSPTTWRKRG